MFDSVLENLEFSWSLKGDSVSKSQVLTHLRQRFKACNVTDKLIVSLSGGVDSMVIASCANFLGIKTICVHINYNNRGESVLEAEFLRQWCEHNQIFHFEYINILDLKRETSDRSQYELETRKIRMESYKSLMDRFDAKYVCLGHHDGDIVENVMMNIFKNRDLLDLTVMKELSSTSAEESVTLFRPLLGLFKRSIFDFAHMYDVPYFKDTTPDWSVRGMLRKLLIPMLRRVFPRFEQALIGIGKQSDDWSEVITQRVVSPFLEQNVSYSVTGADSIVTINYESYEDMPESFFRRVWTIVFHSMQYSLPSHKAMTELFKIMKNTKEKKIILSPQIFAVKKKESKVLVITITY